MDKGEIIYSLDKKDISNNKYIIILKEDFIPSKLNFSCYIEIKDKSIIVNEDSVSKIINLLMKHNIEISSIEKINRDVNYPVPMFKNTLFTAVMEKFIINYTSMKPIFGVLIEISIINFVIALFFNGIGIFTSSLFKNKVAPLIFLMFSFLGIYFFPKIFNLKDITNPVVYGNAYEWVTGIKTLINSKITVAVTVLVISALTIYFSYYKDKKG
ncbi:hypothetical protein [Clostridium tarantellae]|uniref:Uncharacterized protein n=1 Tax=Clostridium tarantellae TaxID=39493 RepID=A0A6I1MQD5_9CLOT|nr:hypothetical protein [Clostridium tarantellae]MPQ44472.1 hypothetical protein [Clostridium tarantellae]